MAGDAVVTIGTDLSDLRRDLAKLPNLSSEAAQKTLIQIEKAVHKAELVAKQSAKAVKKANRQAMREAEKAAKDAQEGFKGLIELSGASGDKIDKLKNVIGALSTPVGQVTVAATAAALAVTGLAAGITSAVLASDELADSLEPYYAIEGFGGIPPEALATIDRANGAVDGLGVVAKQAVVVLGAEFAPVVETTAKTLLKMGLMGLDALRKFADGKDLLRELAVFLTDSLVQAFTSPISSMMNLIGLMGDLADAVGAEELGASLSGLNDKWDSFTRGIAETAVDFYFDAASDSADGLNDALSDYDTLADSIIGKSVEPAKASKTNTSRKSDEKDATDELRKAEEARIKAMEQAAALVAHVTDYRLTDLERIDKAEREAMEKLLETEVATQDQILAVQEEFKARREDLREKEAEHAREVAEQAAEEARKIQDAYLDSASTIVGAAADVFGTLAETMSEKNRDAAMAAFAVAKVAALSQVVIDTALAISNVNAAWAAAPPVAAALSAAALAVGGAQAAAIAAEQPSFHVGGLIAARGNQAPDEVSIRAQAGEAVLNRRAAERLGERGVNRLNRGQAPDQNVLVVQQYKHRTFDVFMQDHLKLPDSSLRKAMAGKTRVGHRSR